MISPIISSALLWALRYSLEEATSPVATIKKHKSIVMFISK